MKRRIMLIGVASCFWLTACSNVNGDDEASSKAAEEKSSNVDLLNQPFEEITAQEWETLYLSKEDFDLYLTQLQVKDANGVQEIDEVKMGSGKISIILNNHDGESLDNLMAAPFLDTMVRQVYIRSAYYQGKQPTIIISDLSGTLLSKTVEPLETVNP
ncbi:hypothetical protein QWY16_14315 [Planococcus shenhongbingii]|uniref:Uncharacterized protein n=1 Tax=Planococcus shenhongbingii TaxID=3058398 RepID=A0ABT8N9E9_9BACL|nr:MULTISPECIES: hypothetical protein [unclassified Planococcus (in: firmicutes)]MDN7244502.1 hypothetical protein [Planococcus sp. N017]WKA57665.1 hypothetical protein QWY16_14315 [Planococcus sp. N016]